MLWVPKWCRVWSRGMRSAFRSGVAEQGPGMVPATAVGPSGYRVPSCSRSIWMADLLLQRWVR